ncbi:MAG: T9SS type A sorting domain-containing protein [Lewinellaceae bacterium]|jgi:hypothetical protein|nr:T9SS type A sorting domain-containing protein [Lewinellaceae bacterium]
MKNIYLLFVCLFFFQSGSLFAQNWFENNPEWVNYFTFGFAGSGYEYVSMEGDTVLGGHPAIVMKRFRDMNSVPDNTDLRIVRQSGDTIFCWNDLTSQYNLTYNFDLEVGDSVAIPEYWSGNSVFSYVVESNGVMSINGQSLRVQTVRTSSLFGVGKCSALIVEKIGMINGQCVDLANNITYPEGHHFFLDEVNSGAADGPEWFLCRYENDLFEYKSTGSNCDALTGAEEAATEEIASFLPNPFSDQVSFSVPTEKAIASVRFLDATGRPALVLTAPVSGTVSTSRLPAGAYFIEIISTDHKRSFLRAVKQ